MWPESAASISNGVTQIFAEEYSNPDTLPPGAVLIAGSGQTGCQLAEELHDAGRKVFLACGRCQWTPRRIGDRDFMWWAVQAGFLDAKARREERWLRVQFPAYAEYAAKVRRLIPWLY